MPVTAMTRCQLPPALQTFAAMHPNVAVRILEAYSHVLTEKVRAGELDFAIVPATARPLNGLRETLFMRTRECLVSSTDSTLEHGKAVGPEDMNGIKLVLPGHSNARRESLEKYLSVNGIDVARRLELDAMLGTLGLVMSSDWKAIIPGLLMASDIRDKKRQFTINPIKDPEMWLDLILIEPLRQPLSAAAMAFLETIREVAAIDNAVETGIFSAP